MNFTVDYLAEAENALAEAWLQAAQSSAVTIAQNEIDHLLARDPIGNGQYLHEGLYQIVQPPLTVFYAVDVPRHRVEVTEVWYTP